MSSSSVWMLSFTTFRWKVYLVRFHPTDLYKIVDTQFCAKYNRGVCSAIPVCTRLCFSFWEASSGRPKSYILGANPSNQFHHDFTPIATT